MWPWINAGGGCGYQEVLMWVGVVSVVRLHYIYFQEFFLSAIFHPGSFSTHAIYKTLEVSGWVWSNWR